MPGATGKVTPREKAALLMHITGIETDWKQLYLIASEKPTAEILKQNAVSTSLSRWKGSDKIRKAYQDLQRQYFEIITRERDEAKQEVLKALKDDENKEKENIQATEDIKRTNTDERPRHAITVDYSNPDNQRKKLNQIVNDAKDAGEALDALKVIISGQKADRDAAREQKQVRAYLPITCNECPLMEKARKKAQNGTISE